jgi:hypothetical protein
VDEVKVSKDHLPILLSHHFRKKSTPLRVHSPLYNLDLFSITKDLNVSGIISLSAFEQARDSSLSREPEIGSELPEYRDFKNALLASGCNMESKWVGTLKELLKNVSLSKDRDIRPNPLVVAPDTNVLYWRVFSRHLPLMEKSELRLGDLSFVISEAVIGEVDAGISRKYRRDDLRLLEEASGWKGVYKFQNKGTLRTRMAKLAQNEIHYLKGERRALECSAREHPGEKEAGDRVIADSYAKFGRDSKVDVLLMTGDQDMSDHAVNKGLSCLLLSVPYRLPRSCTPDPWAIQYLLHDLAILFGAIKLVGTGATIWGEWPGKTVHDYRGERLQLSLTPSATATDPFSRDLEICEKMWKG